MLGAVKVKLYVIKGSHPCRSAMLMLDYKGIPFELVTLPSGMHSVGLALAGFAGSGNAERKIDGSKHPMVALNDRLGTVPALRYGEQRVMTNHDIARFIEAREPLPALFPEEPERRERVEEAEAWGDDVLQMTARRLILTAGGAGKLTNGGSDGYLGPLLFSNPQVRRVAAKGFAHVFASGPGREAQLMDEARELLDGVDARIADGAIDGEELSVADFVIAPSVALLAYHRELADDIAARPAGRMLEHVFAVRPPQPAAAQPTA
jgi:glutathione S-transferase